jgi:hypothetical protein
MDYMPYMAHCIHPEVGIKSESSFGLQSLLELNDEIDAEG